MGLNWYLKIFLILLVISSPLIAIFIITIILIKRRYKKKGKTLPNRFWRRSFLIFGIIVFIALNWYLIATSSSLAEVIIAIPLFTILLPILVIFAVLEIAHLISKFVYKLIGKKP